MVEDRCPTAAQAFGARSMTTGRKGASALRVINERPTVGVPGAGVVPSMSGVAPASEMRLPSQPE